MKKWKRGCPKKTGLYWIKVKAMPKPIAVFVDEDSNDFWLCNGSSKPYLVASAKNPDIGLEVTQYYGPLPTAPK